MRLSQIFAAMENICPSVANHLQRHWHDKVSTYLSMLWQKPISCSSVIATQARAQFYAALKLFFASQPIDFARVFSEFERYPILQTGPHCQLYVNQVDFNALMMSWMGAKLHRLNHIFVLNSITRTVQWTKNQGPGWLNLRHDTLNVFDLTPKKMSQLSVCAPYPDLTFNLEKLSSYLNHTEDSEKKGLEKLMEAIQPKTYGSFIQAFTLANYNLFTQADRVHEIKPLLMNDYFSSLLVANHVLDEQGIIYKLIFSTYFRSKLKQIIHSMQQNKHHLFLKQGTEYFWGVRDNKIRALKITDNYFLEESKNPNKQLKIRLDSQSLYQALINGVLIPNIFLSFLVLSLLPQIRVLGGTRQIAYFPLIQKIFNELLDPNIQEEQELRQEILNNDLNAWGTNFIQGETTPLQWLGLLPQGKELSTLGDNYLNQSVANSTNKLIIFKEHPTWKHLI